MATSDFGDNSTSFMRGGTMTGGIRVETGCYTQCDSTVLKIPTTFNRCFAVIVQGDTSVFVLNQPDVSASFIVATVAATPNGVVLNYIATGF